jgi:hypothetical protein
MATKAKICNAIGTFHVIDIADPPQEYLASIVRLWSNLPQSLRERTYEYQGRRLTVQLDPSPIHTKLREQAKICAIYSSPKPRVSKAAIKSLFKKITVPVEVTVSGGGKSPTYRPFAESFVEAYFYDLFLILNIALPAAANFSNIFVVDPEHPWSKDQLGLSTFYFETAALREDGSWPRLTALDLSDVVQWFSLARNGASQIPSNPIEKAMFALLHLCRSQGGPEDVIWIFYALESLLETRPGENFAALVDRIALLLEPNEREFTCLRKNFRKLYDLRSSFVHGGLEILHPMHNEVLDKRVESSYISTLRISEFGAALLLACLQRYAKEKWLQVRYSTTLNVIKGVG